MIYSPVWADDMPSLRLGSKKELPFVIDKWEFFFWSG